MAHDEITNDNEELEVRFDPNLKPGDVALILPKEGEPFITHHIESLHETGQLVGGQNSAGIMMALALVNVVAHDEAAFAAAMRRVAMLLNNGKLSLVH